MSLVFILIYEGMQNRLANLRSFSIEVCKFNVFLNIIVKYNYLP